MQMKTAMRTHIFAYNGYVGILSHPEAEHFIAHPGNGNLGCVVDAKGVDISPDALTLIKQIRNSRDSIGDFDVFQAGDKIIIGWLGGYMKAFEPSKITGSNTYNPNLLKSSDNVIVPEGFKKFIDDLLKKQK